MNLSVILVLSFLVIGIKSLETKKLNQSATTTTPDVDDSSIKDDTYLYKSDDDSEEVNYDEKWVWGNVEHSPNKENVSKTSEVPEPYFKFQTEEDPCKKRLPRMPDFRASGKRLAEQKCDEYVWNVKNRFYSTELYEQCKQYKIRTGQVFYRPVSVGGRDAEPLEFPHMGAIGWKDVTGSWVFKCGSTLISPNFVLTAGHCTKYRKKDNEIEDLIPKIIRFGDLRLNTFELHKITRIIVHPEYMPPKKYNDIALMEFDPFVSMSETVQAACLWPQFDTKPLGTKATATGWGVSKLGRLGEVFSPILQVVDLEVIDSQTCDELLHPLRNRLWSGIQDTQICAGNLTGGVDVCQGDSGGPLQVKIPLPTSSEGGMHYVIGVTSFGHKCARENSPGLFTRVSAYLDWIEEYAWKKVEDKNKPEIHYFIVTGDDY